MQATRDDVLGYRVRVQQLDGGPARGADVLDLGVQDSGTDGAAWALANRALHVEDPVLLWSHRASPHLYRRGDHPSVVAAAWPLSEADAAKRVLDASKQWRAAGLASLGALEEVARALRDAVDVPRVKGEVSTRVTQALPAPYRRTCVPCGAVHLYEVPFRLATLHAGLELQPGTSPPVLERSPSYARRDRPQPRHDVVRLYLHLLGPATAKHVAGFLDAPVKDVQAHWPQDAVPVQVDGEPRWLLADDTALLGPAPDVVRLLGPYDLYLQALRDRELLLPDPARRKALFTVIGKPGAVLSRGEVVGAWRPRKSGARLRLQLDLWGDVDRDALHVEAERLAASRGAVLEEVA